MVQLSVPLYFGIFSRIGTARGALGGMLAGIAVVVVLQVLYPLGIPWAYGLTAGVVGRVGNLAFSLGFAALAPTSAGERVRVDALFAEAGSPTVSRPGEAVRAAASARTARA